LLSTIAILLIWFITWPSAVEKLSLYRQALDLHAWVYLREAVNSLASKIEVFDIPADESIVAYEIEIPASPRDSGGGHFEDLAAQAIWPEVKPHLYELIPKKSEAPDVGRIYKVDSKSADLPFSDYLVAFLESGAVFVLSDELGVATSGTVLGFDSLERGLLLEPVEHPRTWNTISRHLRKYRFGGQPSELDSTSPALAQLQLEADPRLTSGGVQIFGMKLSLAIFVSSVGIILAALAFALIGPVVRLWNIDSKKHTQPWVFAIPRQSSFVGWGLEGTVNFLLILWALSPLIILVLQSNIASEIAILMPMWVIIFGKTCLILSSAMFSLTVITLWKIRRRQ